MSIYLLEGENFDPIEGPTPAKVRDVIESLGKYETSFAVLTLPSGNYVQAAGDGEFCTLEKREHDPIRHCKAHYSEGSEVSTNKKHLITGAGEMTLEPDEFIRLSDAADFFEAFLEGRSDPNQIAWRSLNEFLGL